MISTIFFNHGKNTLFIFIILILNNKIPLAFLPNGVFCEGDFGYRAECYGAFFLMKLLDLFESVHQ